MLVALVRSDKGDKNILRFNMPWAWFSNYITVKQILDLGNMFVTNAATQKNLIQAYKNNIDDKFAALKNFKKVLTTAKTNAAALKAQIDTNLKKNHALLSEKRKTMGSIEKR